MATNYVTVKGYIKNGKLEVDLPENVEDCEVEVTVAVVAEAEETLSPEEMLQFEGKTLGEILDSRLVGTWSDRDDITDSGTFVEELRRKEVERYKW